MKSHEIIIQNSGNTDKASIEPILLTVEPGDSILFVSPGEEETAPKPVNIALLPEDAGFVQGDNKLLQMMALLETARNTVQTMSEAESATTSEQPKKPVSKGEPEPIMDVD